LYGKALTHIDRLTAYAARRYALSLVQQGATEARVQVCFAPGLPDPLLVDIQSPIRPREDPKTYFNFENMQRFVQPADLHYHLPAGAGFYNHALSHAQPSLPVVSIKPL
jgi:S-adenosylmethionine synthetase